MKWTFQLALYERVKSDPRVILVMGDVGFTLFRKLRADFPRQVINAGLCEQSMVSMAAGMAMAGLRPICYTITPFLIERAFEQIKLDVDQMNLPVGLVGYSDNSAGPTHIERDAFRLMRLLPRIRRLWPKTKEDLTVLIAKIDLESPWFMALKPAS